MPPDMPTGEEGCSLVQPKPRLFAAFHAHPRAVAWGCAFLVALPRCPPLQRLRLWLLPHTECTPQAFHGLLTVGRALGELIR